jgi:hypothetical protein
MPIDHLFSLLEDEFERQDIERVIDDNRLLARYLPR